MSVTRDISEEAVVPCGIGGWLILPVLGLLAAIVVIPVEFISSSFELGFEGFSVLWTSFRFVSFLVVLSGLLSIIKLFLAAICLKFLFTWDSRAPLIMIIYFATGVGVSLFEAGSATYMASAFEDPSLDDTNARTIVPFVIAAAVWIPYFRVSERIANTYKRAS